MTVDATGVTVPSVIEAVDRVLRVLQVIFGADLSLSNQTPQTQLAAILAVPDIETGEALAAVFAGVDPRTAPGVWLDVLGGWLMTERRAATRSRVTATVAGEAATSVPAGNRAATGDGDEFVTLADVVLSPSGVAVDMQAAETGPVQAAAGTLTRIVSVIPGWETITNAEAATVGADGESDAEYRQSYAMRAARRSVGPIAALEAALADADAAPYHVRDNGTGAAVTVQDMAINAYSLLVVAASGTDGDVRRAVENHKGMCVPTMTAIQGGTPNNTTLDGVSNGAITWAGNDYTGLDLTAASDDAAKAAALTTLLAGRSGVSVRSIDSTYRAFFEWRPTAAPVFADGTVADAFGLSADGGAVYPAGPFLRARGRALTVVLAVIRATGFPADGLAQIRAAVIGRVDGYGVGETLWVNDILVAAETVAGTRVTSSTVQYGGSDLAGAVIPPLDARWSLALTDLTVTVT